MEQDKRLWNKSMKIVLKKTKNWKKFFHLIKLSKFSIKFTKTLNYLWTKIIYLWKIMYPKWKLCKENKFFNKLH